MPVVNASQTVSDALHTATAMLTRSSPSPRLDAELLLEYVTGLSRTNFRTTPERELPAAAGWSFQQLVKRRLQGEPVAYILGQQEFWSLMLEVTPAVLVPRPETELVVERALEHLDGAAKLRVVDLGTGSGAIALAIASERPSADVLGIDLSKEALGVAQRNAARLGIANARFQRSHWFDDLPAESRFDLIAANPPYVAEGDSELAADVRRYEPGLALFSGRSGFEALEQIIAGAAARLEPGGWLVLEHGWKQGAEVRSRLVSKGYAHVRSHADLAGHERVTEGRIAPR